MSRASAFPAAVVLGALSTLAGCTGAEPEPSASSATSDAAASPSVGPPSSASANPVALGDLVPVALTVRDGIDAGAAEGRSLNVPAGWTAEVWAAVPGARLAVWAPDGRLLVSTGKQGAVWSLMPAREGEAPDATILLDGLSDPQGLAFTSGGSTLVLGESAQLTAFDYVDGTVSGARVILGDLPTQGHGRKAVVIEGDTVYYSLGSSANRSASDRTADPERAVIAAVELDGSGNRVFASGVRNGFALDFAPDGTLFVAVNQMDNLPYPYVDDSDRFGEVFTEFVNDHPVEQVARLTEGVDLGWPYCVPDSRYGATALPYVRDAELNADGSALDCSRLPQTMVGLPAHSAPLGLTFTHDTEIADVLGSGALIGAHGSWNRTPPQEPYVAFLPWNDSTATLGSPQYLVTGFQDDDGSRWGRAVMAVVGPDGAIYLTDDAAGLVYRIAPSV